MMGPHLSLAFERMPFLSKAALRACFVLCEDDLRIRCARGQKQ